MILKIEEDHLFGFATWLAHYYTKIDKTWKLRLTVHAGMPDNKTTKELYDIYIKK